MIMDSIGAFDAKTRFSALLERVDRGEEITVTRRGRPIARLVPVDRAGKRRDSVGDVVRQLKILRAGQRLGGLSIRKLRDAGRR
jgi:prevent-host-death family protein